MIVLQKKTQKNNSNWTQSTDHPHRIVVAGGSGSGKATALLNLMKQQNNDYNIIDKIYLYVKDRNEAKCQYLIKKHEEIGLKEHEDKKAFIEYSNNMQNVHTNIEEYNPNRKRKE